MAIAVMMEMGIDISWHRSKLTGEFYGTGIETVVTVCDAANKACPFFPGAQEVIHQSFPDPSVFTGSDEEVRAGFRSVRDEIIRWIDETFGTTPA
jgi:arsenate reductase